MTNKSRLFLSGFRCLAVMLTIASCSERGESDPQSCVSIQPSDEREYDLAVLQSPSGGLEIYSRAGRMCRGDFAPGDRNVMAREGFYGHPCFKNWNAHYVARSLRAKIVSVDRARHGITLSTVATYPNLLDDHRVAIESLFRTIREPNFRICYQHGDRWIVATSSDLADIR